VELGLRLQVCDGHGHLRTDVPVPLSGAQLASRQALLHVDPGLRPKKTEPWTVRWCAGSVELESQRARSVTTAIARRSLRVVGTRFIVIDGSGLSVRRHAPPPGEASRVGPCFLLASTEPGLAARFNFEVFPQGSTQPAWSPTVLVTDGPTAIAPGTIPANDVLGLNGFELRLRGRLLTTLPMHPAPTAKLTAEGGFTPPTDFIWTPAAEEELAERLTKLTGL
jgi:hypothetical protein